MRPPQNKIHVQIYEIQDPAEAEAVIRLGVDQIGSVLLSEADWRRPAVREVVRLAKAAGVRHSLIPLVGRQETLDRIVEFYEPDIIHFCERLTEGDGSFIPCERLIGLQYYFRTRYPGIEIMRSIPVAPPEFSRRVPTLEISRCFEDLSDYFLIDTWFDLEPVSGYIGITGQTCDWEVSQKLVQSTPIPVILAGGLSPENVYRSIMEVRPYGVDSCTRTNAADAGLGFVRFKKDLNKVKAFVEEARRAERDLLQEA